MVSRKTQTAVSECRAAIDAIHDELRMGDGETNTMPLVEQFATSCAHVYMASENVVEAKGLVEVETRLRTLLGDAQACTAWDPADPDLTAAEVAEVLVLCGMAQVELLLLQAAPAPKAKAPAHKAREKAANMRLIRDLEVDPTWRAASASAVARKLELSLKTVQTHRRELRKTGGNMR